MKKVLLIIGIICMLICAVFLVLAAINMFGYYHVLDGTAELYDRLHRRMTLFPVVGIVFAAIGSVCMIVRSKV